MLSTEHPSGRDREVLSGAPSVFTDVETLQAGYLAWVTGAAGLAPTTTRTYAGHVTGYLDWLTDTHPSVAVDLRHTNRRHVEGYLALLAARGCTPSTRRVALHALRSFYAWALGRSDTPAAATRRPRSRPPVTLPYREVDAEAILAHASTSASAGSPQGALAVAALATLRWAGLRSHELCGLPRSGVDLETGLLTAVGKGRKQRVIPMPEVLVGHLTDYLAHADTDRDPGDAGGSGGSGGPGGASGLVFRNPAARGPSGALTGRALLDLCRRHGTGAGVPGPHTPLRWRHTYATLTLARGTDLFTLAKLLGHARIETTQRYLALDTTQLAAAVARAYPASDR